MAKDKNAPEEEEGGEFADFMADISQEIAQRVESLDARPKAASKEAKAAKEKKKTPALLDAGVILEWPTIADRIIEEIR